MFIARPINRFVAFALVLAISISPRVVAQGYRMGVSTALPRPVSSLELARYAQTLTLTAEQQRAWSAIHEAYKADFKALSDEGGVLARFIEARKAAEGVPFRAQPPRAVIERWMDAHQSATSAIRTLDERLFDELLPLLTETQQPLLQRARLAREHARLLGDELVNEWMVPATQMDLSELFLRMLHGGNASTSALGPIDDERIAAVREALDAHQAQYIALLRDVQKGARSMYRDWARLLTERGVPVNAVDLSKRDTMDREMFTKVSAAWREAGDAVRPTIVEMIERNRAKARSIAATLESPAKERFLHDYLIEAYPGSVIEFFDSHVKTLERALTISDLTDIERAGLESQAADARRIAIEISERIADSNDMDSRLRGPNSSGQTPESRAMREEAMLRTNAEMDRLRTALYDVIPNERLRTHFSASRDERNRKMLADAGITDSGEMEDALEELKRTGTFYFDRGQSPDSLTPDALPRAGLEAACRSLNAPDDALEIVGRLHRDYAIQYRRTRDEALSAVNKFALGGFLPRADGTMGYATPDEVAQARAIETEAIGKLRALDAALLGDVQAALGIEDDSLWRVRLAREWATLARGPRKSPGELRTYEAYVPLMPIVDGLSLNSDDQAKSDAVFLARSDEFRAAASAHFEANRSAWYAREMAFAMREGPVASTTESPSPEEKSAIDAERTAGEKRAALAGVVRSILDELVAALPAHAEALIDGFERAAYPQVFKDRKVERDAMARALALRDLTADQRAELESEVARYRIAQREVIVRLIAANREWDKQRPYSSFANPEREEAKLKWDQVKFERDELDAGMLATLRRLLTHEQQQAIGVDSK